MLTARRIQVRLAETEVIKDKSKAKRRKLERALQGEIKEKNKLPKDAFRVEHLNYKVSQASVLVYAFTTDNIEWQRLIPGTKVLAQIVAVRPLELVVSLPNQLLGHIPITNISPEFTTRLEEAGDASDEDDSDGDSADASEKSPSLSSLFKEGHWVSAIVVASKSSDSKRSLGGREGDENVRASRRVELSLEPAKVNDGVAKGYLKAGFVRGLPAYRIFQTVPDKCRRLSRRSQLPSTPSKITDTSSLSVCYLSHLSSLTRKRKNCRVNLCRLVK